MTWAIVMLILMSLVKIVLTCLPTGVIEWLLGKFEVHAKLSDENASLSRWKTPRGCREAESD